MQIITATSYYNDKCREGEEKFLQAASMVRQHLPYGFKKRWGTHLLPRPVFADSNQMKAYSSAVCELLNTIFQIPELIFRGDLQQYAEAVGVPRKGLSLLTMNSGDPPPYGRLDAVKAVDGMKILELNLGSEIGGIDSAVLAESWRMLPSLQPFYDMFQVEYINTADRIADDLRVAAFAHLGNPEPVIAIVEPDGHLNDFLAQSRGFVRALKRQGLRTVLGEVHQLDFRGPVVRMRGQEVNVVLRYFTETEINESSETLASAQLVFDAHEEKRVLLWTTLRSKLFASKNVLAILHSTLAQNNLPQETRKLIQQLIPWSTCSYLERLGSDASVNRLKALCIEEQEDLLLKPSYGHSGHGIAAGWRISSREWVDVVNAALRNNWLIQRRVHPQEEYYYRSNGQSRCHFGATWSSFITSQGLAGTVARTLPLDNCHRLNVVAPVFPAAPIQIG